MIAPTGKRTLHILLDYTPSDSIIDSSYWRECFYDEDFNDFNINIIEGQNMSSDSYLWSDTAYKNVQLKNILNLLQNNKIKNGDIFVFTNAWNFIAAPLSYFRHEYGLDIKLVGFWGQGVYNPNSPQWRMFQDKNLWGKHQELMLMKTYDLNCFLSQEHYDLFEKKYKVIRTFQRVQVEVTGYPFQYLSRNLDTDAKKKKVVFPYELNDEFHVPIFKGFRFEMPEYEFVIARENYNNRNRYRSLLNESIGMFCGKRTEWNPVVLYEGMVRGLIPFVPDQSMFQIVFPDKYRYLPSLVAPKNNKMLYLVRNSFQLKEFLKEKLDTYDTWKDVVAEDAKVIGDTYYSNSKFKTLLCQL